MTVLALVFLLSLSSLAQAEPESPNAPILTVAVDNVFAIPGEQNVLISVNLAVINFLRYTYFRNKTTYFGPHPDCYMKPVPPNGHVSLWMEEAKLSPATLEAAGEKE